MVHKSLEDDLMGRLKVQDRGKWEDQIRSEANVNYWKMQDQTSDSKMQDRKMWDRKMRDRKMWDWKMQDQSLLTKNERAGNAGPENAGPN